MIYIAIVPFQWRWALQPEEAMTSSLESYKYLKDNGTYRIKIPMELHSLNEGISKKKFLLNKETKLLAKYYATARNGTWQFERRKHGR